MAAGLSLDLAIGRLRRASGGAGGSALAVFAVRIAAAGCAYLAQVLMARLMGEAEYGIFAAVWVWIAILGHTATLGLSQGACRFIPADQVAGRYADVRGFLAAGALVSVLTASAMSLAGYIALSVDGSVIGGSYGAAVLLAAFILPLFAFQDFLEGVARSQDWAVLAIAPPYLVRQAAIMGAMVAAVLSGAPAKASVAIACTLFATAAAAALQAAMLLARLRTAIPAGPRRYRWRRWFAACLPIAAGDLVNAAFGFADVVVLSFFVTPSSLGLYFAATRIQQFVVFVQYAASAATAQRFSMARARGDHAGLAALVREQARWTCLATVTVGLGTLAAAPLLLGLFGPDFSGSLPILAILVAGSAAASLFGPGEDLLTMLGGERLAAGITAAMLTLAIALCLVLLPSMGTVGAALAVAVASAARGLAMAVGVRAIHGLSTPVFPFTRKGSPR